MEYGLENDVLLVRVNERGAELAGVLYKPAGREMIWDADPEVWGRHAPLLFPYCGRLRNDTMCVRGKPYHASRHGFARNRKFRQLPTENGQLVLRLESGPETRLRYPYEFALTVYYRLSGNKLHQTVEVENLADTSENRNGEPLPFSIGFHPGFKLPLCSTPGAAGHEIVFDGPQSPIEVKTQDGYLSGEQQPRFTGQQSIELTDDLFANDSICLKNLNSKTVTLREKTEKGCYVRLNIEDFPYLLLWGPPKGPLPFVCLEPWHSLPDGGENYGEFSQKPGIVLLQPGQCFETTLTFEFGGR